MWLFSKLIIKIQNKLKKLLTWPECDDMAEIELHGNDWAMRWHWRVTPPVIYNIEIYFKVTEIYTYLYIKSNYTK